MSGPQFAHIQTWCRKPNKVGQSVSQIIAEAIREPGFSMHVEAPLPPRVLIGDPAAFEAAHDAHVAARSTRAKMADGQERVRAIRKDRHTMASIVMSYPVPRDAIRSDEARARLAAWERRNIQWLQASYGGQLRVVMAHDDETYFHLHAWLLADDPGADATTLHPGKVAKKEAEAAAKAEGATPAAALRLGNRALKAAMRVWQDDYYRGVGAPEGLTRTGPKRLRLTGAEWRAAKDAAVVTAAVAAEARAEAEAIEAAAEAIRAQAERDAAAMMAEAEAAKAGVEEKERAEMMRQADYDAQVSEWLDAQRAEIARRRALLDAEALGLEAVAQALGDDSLRETPEGVLQVKDAAPVKAGPWILQRILPAVRHVIGLRRAAEADRQAAAVCLAETQAERIKLRSLAAKVSLWLFKPDLTAEQRQVGIEFVNEVQPRRAERALHDEGDTPSNSPPAR